MTDTGYQITDEEKSRRVAILAMEILQDVIEDWRMGADADNRSLAIAMQAHAAHLLTDSDDDLISTTGYAEDLTVRKVQTLAAYRSAEASQIALDHARAV